MTPATLMVSYLVLTFLIGLYLTKSNKGVQEFLVAKRELGIVLIIPLLFAENIGGATTVGVAAAAYKMGISSVWVNWSMVVGTFVFLAFVLRFYRVLGSKLGIMSVPEAYKFMFDNKTRVVMVFIYTVMYSILYALQPLAAAAILGPMFQVDTVTMAWILSVIFITLTVTGGLKGLAWMNVVHSFIMYTGLGLVAWLAVSFCGGMAQMETKLPAAFSSYFQPDFWTIVGTVVGISVSYFASPTLAGICFGAKSHKAAYWGILFGALLVVPFSLFPALTGMAAKAQLGQIAAPKALFSMAVALGPWTGGIASMAVIGAIFSTAPALLLVVATTMTRDLYKGFYKPDASEVEQLRFSQGIIIVVGLICTYFGLSVTSIMGQVAGAFQVRAIAGLVLAVALFWPRVNNTAAFWSMLIGGALAAGWHFAGNPFGIAPVWPSLSVGIVLLVGLTLAGPNAPSPGYLKYQALSREAGDDI